MVEEGQVEIPSSVVEIESMGDRLGRDATVDNSAMTGRSSAEAAAHAWPLISHERLLCGPRLELALSATGNLSALDWVLDQYKKMKFKDPAIREKFDTYRFADYKEKYWPAHARHHGERGDGANTQEVREKAR